MDLSGENPFADLMSKAVKLKGHQQAQLRPIFDSWPQYFQHSMFMQESVVSVRGKPFPERIEIAEAMKAKGNELYGQNELDEAVAEYEKALAVFKYVENKDEGWKKKGIEDADLLVVDFRCEDPEHQRRLDALKVSCYLNIAASKFKLKEHAVCIRACDDALEVDPSNVKAYYRRAQALITPASSGALEFDRAISDLQKAYDMDSSNRDVRKLLRQLKEQRSRQRKLDKETFSGMFDRGEIYDQKDEAEDADDSQLDEAAREAKFTKEVDEAESLARMCESKGQADYAKEIRGKIEQAKMARQRRLKQIDFFHPTPEMIEDAKKNGIDLTDKNVQQMLHDLQEKERSKDVTDSLPESADASVESVDSILKSMTNAQIATMLGREGIDYHKITDRDQFLETARQVLMAKLDTKKKPPQRSYFLSVFLLATAWTLLRLYSTGVLSSITSHVWQATTGSEAQADNAQGDDLFD